MASLCECLTPRLQRGSILCAQCYQTVREYLLELTLKALIPWGVASFSGVRRIPEHALPRGAYPLLPERLIQQEPALMADILPIDAGAAATVAKLLGILGISVGSVYEFVRKWLQRQNDIKDACLGVFAEYFGLPGLPKLSSLAHSNDVARFFLNVIRQHTANQVMNEEVYAICLGDRNEFASLTDPNPLSALLRATVELVRSKIMASSGDLTAAYESLKDVWDCKPCMAAIDQALPETGRQLMLRQLLNHSYMLSIDHTGHWISSDLYSGFLAEARRLLALSSGQLPLQRDHWSKLGALGIGFGLHFGNQQFHDALEAADRASASRILGQRFHLATAWDDEVRTQTAWNQYSQVVGQALFIDDYELAQDVLAHATARAGQTDYTSPRLRTLGIPQNPAAASMVQSNLEWLLHLALRDQVAGIIQPDAAPEIGQSAERRATFVKIAQPPRFRRVAQAVLARLYPNEAPKLTADAFFVARGAGTAVFLPKAPLHFSTPGPQGAA